MGMAKSGNGTKKIAPGHASTATHYKPHEIERIMASVFERMGNGEELLRIIQDVGMPPASTLHRWMDGDSSLLARYQRARESLAEHIDLEIRDLIDQTTPENFNATKTKMNALQWRAARLNPKRYGDRIQADVSGDLQVQTTVLDATRLEPDQREALRLALSAATRQEGR
jgi:hypothetical protein